jgi:hypothetical protein
MNAETQPRPGATAGRGADTTTPQSYRGRGDGLAALKQAQARVNRCARALATARARRDELIVVEAGTGTSYRLIAEATRLSTAAIGKIAQAGGVTRYPPRARKDATTT